MKLIFIPFIIILTQRTFPEENPDENLAHGLIVSHFDCSNPENTQIYSMNEVPKCEMAPEDIELACATTRIYQKSYVHETEGHRCELKVHSLTWWCGMHDHSQISTRTSSITRNIKVTAENCRMAVEKGEMNIRHDCEDFIVKTYMDKYHESYHMTGKQLDTEGGDGECVGRGEVTKYTFGATITSMNLTYNARDLSVLNYQAIPLKCKFSESGCDSSLLDPGAYIWDSEKACVMILLNKYVSTMVKWNDRHFMIISEIPGPGEPSAEMKFEIYKDSSKHCGKPELLYDTNFPSIKLYYTGGFDMPTGKNLVPIENKDKLEIFKNGTIQNTGENAWGRMQNGQFTPKSPNLYQIDYDAHINAKLDFTVYTTINQLRSSELEILKKVCEMERTQILSILAMALESTKLAGFLLTGNRSKFLETDGSVAWLYSCIPMESPLKILDRCYNRIPIDIRGETFFVDPITRQTFTFANEVACDGNVENLFHLNMDDPESWYSLLPYAHIHPKPNFFSPKTIRRITQFPSGSAVTAGLYTQSDIKKFWERIVSFKKQEGLLKEWSESVAKDMDSHAQGQGRPGKDLGQGGFYPAPIFIDRLISPDFLTNAFVETFGQVAFYLQLWGSWFAAFLLAKFIWEIALTIIKAFEIHLVAGRTLGFGRVLLAAAFDLFILTAMTNIFSPPTKKETEEHQYDNPSAPNGTEPENEQLQIARNHREMAVMTFHPYLGQGHRMERTGTIAGEPPQNNPDSAHNGADSNL